MLKEISRIGHWIDVDKLNEDSVVVDAGACFGEFIDRIREQVKCRIIAIEPNPFPVEHLAAKEVDVLEGALVGRSMPKEMTFYDYPQKERGNLFELYPSSNENYSVMTLTLDDVFKKTDKVDLLKLDIEGAEKDLIETMTKEDADKIGQISMEVHSNCDINQLKEQLEKLGYKVEVLPRSELYACHSNQGG